MIVKITDCPRTRKEYPNLIGTTVTVHEVLSAKEVVVLIHGSEETMPLNW